MWLFTQEGFISAVAHRDKPDVLLVRARDKQSLKSLSEFTGQKITTTKKADYLYRVEVIRPAFAEWLDSQVDDIDYDNYKNRVHQTRGDEFAAPLHEVWSTMLQVEDTGYYKRDYDAEWDYEDYDRLTYAELS